ncbi:hypothetical protein ACLMJK_003562 [Lecanora helva]
MLPSLSRKREGSKPGEQSPFSSPFSDIRASPIAARRTSLEERRRPAAKFDQIPSPEPPDRIEEEQENEEEGDEDNEGEDVDEDEPGELSPLLPIFSAAHLDALPVYNITHTIRLLVVPRCETTLSWDQLRSPQVSQFLVKPIQQQIRNSHFSRATLYALIANCLQFNKEASMHPGNSGTSKTRALVCELLAIKLLREYSTRELIGNITSFYPYFYFNTDAPVDALSYDFFPLQGLPPSNTGNITPGNNWGPVLKEKAQPQAARISALEIAIRAQSKRFLAHPSVVQQLEAIWAGTIVFHSSADNLHRPPEKVTPNQNRGYGALGGRPALQASPDRLQPAKQRDHLQPTAFAVRRSATLYDPRDASLFKLSRLRVPRYRQFLSTASFAVLLGLYLAVLTERSLQITPLEILFWIWSTGFMLDEVVGFTEQGFSLYIMSFWNAFDLGILLLLACYYGMRLYGILMGDVRKHYVADMAYDLLAANAVLLFPRLFSILDHYRYFSQLLIAFRMMAMDLVAVFILIVISCSGFFVAFTLSFGKGYDAASVAYALFQVLMGFTPAAWEYWASYNLLGKTILTLFLFICHFLIVTILITVLTNSFMAVVQNANEEHQFVFAVNTISMVKSDALFSYVAPTNVIGWLLAPLRYVLPFRQFIRINRTIIKTTHFPILFIIFAYERIILRSSVFEPTDLVENRGRKGLEVRAFEAPGARLNVFSPKQNRLREPSVATFHKDRALDEVFRRPFRDHTVSSARKSVERRKTSNVVNNWMQNMGPNGTASPPVEQDRSVLDRLEARRLAHRRSQMAMRRRQPRLGRDFTEGTTSIVSDPEDFVAGGPKKKTLHIREESDLPTMSMDDAPRQTDADGDDELVTNDEDELLTLDRMTGTPQMELTMKQEQNEDYFQRTPTARPRIPHFDSALANQIRASPPKHISSGRANIQRLNRASRMRNVSTNTVLYDPPAPQNDSSTSSPSRKAVTAKNSARNNGTVTPGASAGRRTPKRQLPGASRPRPIMPPRSAFQSAPDLAGMLTFNNDRGRSHSLTMGLGSDLGDNKAAGGGYVGGMAQSFATQMAFATGALRAGQAASGGNEDQQRMSKLMLARMNTLEEGFREVLKEVKDWRRDEGRGGGDEGAYQHQKGGRAKRKENEKDGSRAKEKTEEMGGKRVE